MGWKNVRDHYGITHIVRMVGDDLHIGSAYVPDLVSVTPAGVATCKMADPGGRIQGHIDAIESDLAKFSELLASRDQFERSIPVYSCSEGRLCMDSCEEFGWPNVTHSGQLMYENSHHLEPADAVRAAISSATSSIGFVCEAIQEAEDRLHEKRRRLVEMKRNMSSYEDMLRTFELSGEGQAVDNETEATSTTRPD